MGCRIVAGQRISQLYTEHGKKEFEKTMKDCFKSPSLVYPFLEASVDVKYLK